MNPNDPAWRRDCLETIMTASEIRRERETERERRAQSDAANTRAKNRLAAGGTL